ncbi:MAG: hypothetical protein A2Y33_07450 [Spirochaetes bacterium GWF1_51_8]|nr:MAG: hypothetical protein A2Y33_07450 [Spirochaetes bacterium GWF1_51_8]
MDKKDFIEKLVSLVNIYELIFDLTITAVSLIVYRLILLPGGFIFIGIEPLSGLFLFFGAQFFTALFFTAIYRRFTEIREDSKFVEGVIKVVMFLGITGLYILMPLEIFHYIDRMPGKNSEFGFVILSLSGLLISLAVYIGTPKDDFPTVKYTIYVPMVVGVACFPVAVFHVFASSVIGGIVFLIVTAGIVVAAVMIKNGIAKRKEPLPRLVTRTGSAFMLFALPVLTAVAIAAWQELSLISTVTGFTNNKLPVRHEDVIIMMTLGGLIPIRLLAALAPPFRIINLAVAVPAMYYYFTSLLAAAEKLHAILAP